MQFKDTKIIIHDWDDTITNSFETYLNWYDLFATYFGLHEPNIKDVRRVWGATVPGIVVATWPELNQQQAELMITEFGKSKVFLDADFTPTVFKNIETTLSALVANDYHLGILSSGRYINIKNAYERYLNKEFMKYHKFLVTQHDTPFHKPDPRVFEKVKEYISDLGLFLQDSIYVGDSLLDYHAAKNAGIGFVAVTTGLNTKKQFSDAGLDDAYIFDAFYKIKPLFL